MENARGSLIEDKQSIYAGSACLSITPTVGSLLVGLLYEWINTGVRVPLEANALYLENGTVSVMLIPCDFLFVGTEFNSEAIRETAKKIGMSAEKISISVTCTHNGPYTRSLFSEAWGAMEAHIEFNRRIYWNNRTASIYENNKNPDFLGLAGSDDAVMRYWLLKI